ncbi:MAG TPA: DUF932 domain-containing protein [Gemmataceae bacterium]
MPTNLLLHCGAREVSEEQLRSVGCPPATSTWYPLPHAQVLDTVRDTLSNAGFGIQNQRFALARKDARFFGTLDLENKVCEGVRLAVGIRSSFDKSFPIGFCCGERVLVCDNLSFGSEVIISKKHTRFGKDRFDEGVAKALVSLREYQQVAAERIDRMRRYPLTDDHANSLMLQAWEEGIISHRLLPKVIHAYREPGLDEFLDRTAWSLFNAFTGVLMVRLSNPAVHASLTIKLQELIGSASTIVPLPNTEFPCLAA